MARSSGDIFPAGNGAERAHPPSLSTDSEYNIKQDIFRSQNNSLNV